MTLSSRSSKIRRLYCYSVSRTVNWVPSQKHFCCVLFSSFLPLRKHQADQFIFFIKLYIQFEHVPSANQALLLPQAPLAPVQFWQREWVSRIFAMLYFLMHSIYDILNNSKIYFVHVTDLFLHPLLIVFLIMFFKFGNGVLHFFYQFLCWEL